MGNYLTATQVENSIGTKRLAQLTAPSGASPVTARTDEEIDRAEGVMDSSLHENYDTPIDLAVFPKAASILEHHTLSITVFNLHSKREVTPDSVVKKWEAALKWLEDIVDGKVTLPTDAPLPAPTSTTGLTIESTPLVSGRVNMEGL